MMLQEMKNVVKLCAHKGYSFVVTQSAGRTYLQLTYQDRDIEDGEIKLQYSRKWLLSPEMTKSEIVQTCFKALLTSKEHRAREQFTYVGRPIFHPHYEVDDLWELSANVRSRRIPFQEGEQGTTTRDADHVCGLDECEEQKRLREPPSLPFVRTKRSFT